MSAEQHVTQALNWVDSMTGEPDGTVATAKAAVAQVHATLALVEQQRIANVIALARLESENQSTPMDALDALYSRTGEGFGVSLKTRPGILAALATDADGANESGRSATKVGGEGDDE